MSGSRADLFLDLQGFIHEINFAPAGPPEHPWPFTMMTNDGHGMTTAQIHEDDAEKIIEFLSRHLKESAA